MLYILTTHTHTPHTHSYIHPPRTPPPTHTHSYTHSPIHIWTHISGVDPGSAGATPPARGSLSDPGDHRVHISFCGLYIASRSTLMCVKITTLIKFQTRPNGTCGAGWTQAKAVRLKPHKPGEGHIISAPKILLVDSGLASGPDTTVFEH